MSDYLTELVSLIEQYNAWTFPVMFLVAFGESFVFLSLLFPGTTILMAAGLLVPEGALPLFPLLSGAILGAVLGDALSWWLGWRYGPLLASRWPLTRHPAWLTGGHAFFLQYGAASLCVGRFFGPLRATIPLIAGIARMPPRPFWLSNVASACLWAPAMLLPGSSIVWVTEHLPTRPAGKIALGALLLAGCAWGIYVVHRQWLGQRLPPPRPPHAEGRDGHKVP